MEKRKISDLIVDIDKMIVNLELNAWMKDVAKDYARENVLAAGTKKGKTIRNLEIAKNMLKSNEPINKIIKYIVLTREELDFLE